MIFLLFNILVGFHLSYYKIHFFLEFLDTPPGFKSGMKFEKKVYDKVDFIHSQPQKIYLSDVLALDDMPEFGDLSAEAEEKDKEEIDLQKVSVK